MPVAKPKNSLPKPNHTFHEFRRYMTTMMYKGKETLAFVASCKHAGCGWSANYIDDVHRDLGMWRHRSEKVTESRRDFFARRFQDADKVSDALSETADKHSHTYETWCEEVETIWCRYTGLMPKDMPDYKGEVDYHMGVAAREAARKMIAKEYDA